MVGWDGIEPPTPGFSGLEKRFPEVCVSTHHAISVHHVIVRWRPLTFWPVVSIGFT
jgi:hypothetical protein